jgi:hypothetical protein
MDLQMENKINEEKSKHVTFTLRTGNCPQLIFNQINIPQADEVKYLGLQETYLESPHLSTT